MFLNYSPKFLYWRNSMFNCYTFIVILGTGWLTIWIKKALQVQISSRFYRCFLFIMNETFDRLNHGL